jgi:hypothetical protein
MSKLNRNYLINKALNRIGNVEGHLHNAYAFGAAAGKVVLGEAFPGGLFANSQEFIDAETALSIGNENNQFSMFGLPVWDNVILRYVVPATGQVLTANLPIALVDVTQTKHIVTTAVSGFDGTVKEFISNGDFHIVLKCTVVGDAADVYPMAEILEINKLLNIKDNITISSTILQSAMGVTDVVVTHYEYSQNEMGMRNVQNLNIELISDNPEQYSKIFLSVPD